MLSYARLVRSRALTNSVARGVTRYAGSSLVNRSNLVVRFQHSESISKTNETITSNTDNIREIENTEISKAERFAQRRAKVVEQLKLLAEKYISIENQGFGQDYAKIFDDFIAEVEPFDARDRGLASTRIGFSAVINQFINKAIAEEDPYFTPEYVLAKASELRICDVASYENLVQFKLKKGDLKSVLDLWVSYLEYKTSENIKAKDRVMRVYTQLAYYETCANEGKAPNPEILQALLQTSDSEKQWFLGSTAKKVYEDQPERYTKIRNALSQSALMNKNPNSLKFLTQGHQAAAEGNSRALEYAYQAVVKSSKLNEIAINEETLVAFMGFFNKIDRRQRSMTLWNDLIKSGIIPSTEAWNELLETVSKVGPGAQRLDQVEGIFQQIPKKNDDTYAKLIQIYSNLKAPEKIEEIITPEKLQNPSIAQAYIQHLSSQKDTTKMGEVFEKFNKENAVISINTYNALLYGYVRSQNLAKASQVLKQMTDNKVKPDVATYSMILDLSMKLSRRRGDIINDEIITELINDMRKNGIDVNAVTMTSIIDGLGKDPAYSDTAILLFSYLEKKKLANHVAYVSIISSMLSAGKIKKAEDYISSMISKGHQITVKHWNLFFDGFMKNQRVDKLKEYYQVFRQSGENDSYPGANKFTYYFLLRGAQIGKDAEFFNLIFKDIEANDFRGLSEPTKKIIKNLDKIKGVEVPKMIQDQLV